MWLQQGGEAQGGSALDCRYRGEELRDAEGGLRTRECASCNGKVRLKLFPCSHPAREPEEVALVDCRTCPWKPEDRSQARWLILRNHLSPGDVLVMTAAVYSLHRHHPGKFVTAVDTTCQAVWEHNPDVVALDEARQHEAEVIQTHYPLVDSSNQRSVHFMQGYCDFLESALGVRVPLLTNRPMLYLSRREKSWINQVQEIDGERKPFWLIVQGVKSDYTTKKWPFYQEVVDHLHGKIRFVQVGKAEHLHRPLCDVIDLTGKTDDRQLIRLVYHADGVICGTTFLMHLAAAFEKPAVILAGGREPRSWNTYPTQNLISRVGALSCCASGGCWKSRTVPLHDGDEKDKSTCLNPVMDDYPVPRCMAMISPEEACKAIESYYTGEVLKGW